MSTEQKNLEKYHPPTSLWSLVQDLTPAHEQEEIKRLLGYSLVEQSLELHDEVSLLLEIWRDYRQDVSTSHSTSIPSRLPEPPEVRNRLKEEIKFFVKCIREKSKTAGWCAEDIISRQKRNVVEYALQESEPTTQSVAVVTECDGRETPVRPCSASTSRSSLKPIESRLQNVKLDAENIDGILQHLKNVLSEEVTCLLDDITFLQNCLAGEIEHQDRASITEPSLNELKQQRSSLEKELLSTSSSSVKPTGTAKLSQPFTSVISHNQRTLASPPGLISSPPLRPVLKPNSKSSDVVDKRKPLKALPSSGSLSPALSLSSCTSEDSAASDQNISQSVSSSASGIKNNLSRVEIEDRYVERRDIPDRLETLYDSGDSAISGNELKSKSPISKPTNGTGVEPVSNQSVRSALRSASPTHVIIRTASGKTDAKLAHLNAVVASRGGTGTQRQAATVKPLPKAPTATVRRGAAQRFRNMVLECRESS